MTTGFGDIATRGQTQPSRVPGIPIFEPAPQRGQQFSAAGSQDFFGSGLVLSNPNIPRFRNTFVSRLIRGTDVIEWELTIWDFTAGLNATWGDFNSIPNRASSSTAWTHIPGHVILPYVVNSASYNTSIANHKGLHHYNIFGGMAIGVGSAANNCLFSATTGAPSARTFTVNGGSITCLGGIVIGGNTSAERLIVGCSGGAGEILSDLGATPTSSGDMHADTNPLWGVIQTGLPDPSGTAAFVNLLYANGNIYRILTTAAIGDAPTSTSTPAPNGGWALGVSAASGPKRAYWVWPKESTAAGMLATPGTLGHIWSTNLEGSDPQKLDIPLKNGITQAAIWQDGIVYTNRTEIYWYRNGRSHNLGWFRDRPSAIIAGGIDSSPFLCVNLIPDGSKLCIVVQAENGSDFASFIEYFEPETWSWSGFSLRIPSSSAVSYNIIPAAGPGIFSHVGRTAHYASVDGTGVIFIRQVWPTEGTNPLYLLGQTFASGASEVISPAWTLPGLIGVQSVLEEMIFGGHLDSAYGAAASTADSTVKIDVGIQGKDDLSFTGAIITETFRERDRTATRNRRFPDNSDAFTLLQLRLTLSQPASDGTDTSPIGTPFVLRGLAFPRGNVRTPRQVRGF
jgi:hypothetical protein